MRKREAELLDTLQRVIFPTSNTVLYDVDPVEFRERLQQLVDEDRQVFAAENVQSLRIGRFVAWAIESQEPQQAYMDDILRAFEYL